MEHFYKALVFLQRTGFRKIVEEQLQNPPTQTELQEMADYLDVDLQVIGCPAIPSVTLAASLP